MTTGAGRDAASARGLGALTLGLAASALLASAWQRRAAVAPREAGPRRTAVAHPDAGPRKSPVVPAQAGTHAEAPYPAAYGFPPAREGRGDGWQSPARALHASAALLAASVLADSAVEHARGSYYNPGMFTPLLVALATLLAGAGAARLHPASRSAHGAVYGTALAVGAAGTAFHVYNLLARRGGIGWSTLFYGAPLGAPAALSVAGLFGLGALRIGAGHGHQLSNGRALCGLVSAALAGTTAEVALLHFRGAYHNPFMWLPVTVPPVACALLGAQAVAPAAAPRRLVRAWLALTGLLGIGGAGFHAYGVSRQMGGWHNLRQNLLSGPPLSAPPSFAALALAGWSSLALLEQRGAAP